MELSLTGDPIDAERAHHFGLVNYLTEPGRALERAQELARQIEANAPIAVRASRRVLLASATEVSVAMAKSSLVASSRGSGTIFVIGACPVRSCWVEDSFS
jgi:enoyl-CoA hydratase/carnithine racemase